MSFMQGHHQLEWLLIVDFDTCQFSASYHYRKNTLPDASLLTKTFHRVGCTEEKSGLILAYGFSECCEYALE